MGLSGWRKEAALPAWAGLVVRAIGVIVSTGAVVTTGCHRVLDVTGVAGLSGAEGAEECRGTAMGTRIYPPLGPSTAASAGRSAGPATPSCSVGPLSPLARAGSLSMGAVCCSAATPEGFSSLLQVQPELPSLRKLFSHLRVQQERSTSEGAAPHPDTKADCSGVFTRTGIKGSLTLRCVTSQQCSHGDFYAIKSAGDLPSAFLSFVPSPAHQSLQLCGLNHSGLTAVLP